MTESILDTTDTTSSMTITNAQYDAVDGENVSIRATIDGVSWGVPIKVGNRFYDEIMRQVAAGDLTIADAE
jgi:hypothetical protein